MDDLQAIRTIVEEVVEDAKLQTAAGFAEVHEKFAEVDKRFDAVDERFAKIDKRFEEVDKRFDEVDEEFAQVHDRLDRIERVQRAEVDRSDATSHEIKSTKRHLNLV